MNSTSRLLLTPAQPDQFQAHYEIHSDPGTNLYNPDPPVPNLEASKRILRQWKSDWSQRGFGYFAVALRSHPDTIIGYGGLSIRAIAAIERLNLYFRFAPKAWGQGFATELGRFALEQGAALSEFGKVFALVRPDNGPSIKVIERLGLQQVDLVDDVVGQPPSMLFAAV